MLIGSVLIDLHCHVTAELIKMANTSFDKHQLKVLLLEGVHPKAEQLFRQDGYHQVESLKTALSAAELKSALQDCHFLGIRSRSQITPEVLAEANKLVAIGCFCIGTNQVNLTAAQHKGIPVFNAPYSNTRSVAELVLGEIIMLLRGIPAKNAAAHRVNGLKRPATPMRPAVKHLEL